MKFIHLIIISAILVLSACSGEQNSSGLTIADRIELSAGQAGALSFSTEWSDNGGPVATTDLGTIVVSNVMAMTFSYDTGNRYAITSVSYAGVPETVNIDSGSGTITYDYIADTVTVAGSGVISDSDATVPFTYSMTIPGVALNTLSQASKLDLADYEPINVIVNYDGTNIPYSLSIGPLI